LRRFVARDTGSSPDPELAATLHRLRSTLARLKAELELAGTDGEAPPVPRLLADLREALDLVSVVEAATLNVVRVLVLDDDERLGELTARGLRRLGYEAESTPSLRPLRAGEVMVLDLGLVASLGADGRAALRAAKPIVVTGATDAASRSLATSLGASDYLVKPVEMQDLVAAINRRTAALRL
jgi:CheY-like chemotaxis protein